MKKVKQVFRVRKREMERPFVESEAEHIVERARTGEAKVVAVRELVFFSTDSQDAWMLDAVDGLAAQLCRAGQPVPVRIEEGDVRFAIEWTHDFELAGSSFVAVEKRSDRLVRCEGYPVSAIAEALDKAGRAAD